MKTAAARTAAPPAADPAMTAILAPPESPLLSSGAGVDVAVGVVVIVAVVVCPALVVVMVLVIAVLLVVLVLVAVDEVETLDCSAIQSFLEMDSGVFESKQCKLKISQVLSMSSGSSAAMHFAALMTKLPPLLQRH